jgi:hypothetical protein
VWALRLLGGTGSYKATIAMLIISIFRWMIVDVCGVVCEPLRFLVPLIFILLDE